ncbi:hypothetical protein [Staphylococcus saprophyticus]|uniref:hypothetical protein n=1 Tax=Staphylococcus saprophyticus TaxID=29385 RepID=UPI0010132F94|nr:hypothetical protein [Staphylococcus saprophyticus]RXS21391.1 hypothetical protein EUA51_06500 [Staphylococcus saprophyticus]
MNYERTTKDSVEYIANKFAENPGHFAATILRMYWDMEKQRDQYKSERDTLIDDIAMLKTNISRLKREDGELQEVIEDKNSDLLFTEDEIIQLEKDFKNKHNLLSEFSQHIGNKPSSSTYKYFRAKLDDIGIKEGE